MRRTISSLSVASLALITSLASATAVAAIGGPDAGGYSFADQADGATFNYVDIQGTGTLLATGDEDTGNTALGAPFTFYGVVHNDMSVSTNGFLTDQPGEEADLGNSCPLPNPADAPSFRIAALHDDLVTDVFYQYFDQASAAVVGFPGESAGISVFQWAGRHFGGAANSIDVEVVLFHDDNTVLTMINADSDGGSGSTLGIQDPTGTTGLTYGCNTGGYNSPGVSAIEFTAGTTPDSDCCTASGTGTAGCTHPFCQTAVCADDATCCTDDWDAACATAAVSECQIACGAPPELAINEIRTDQPGADEDEYFEIAGPPGYVFQDVQYLVLGDTPTGEIETVVDLTGETIPASGLLLVAESSFTLGAADVTTLINFENADTVTHMLVGGLTGSQSDNLDGDADGVLDSTPWLVAFDTVALVDVDSTDLPYGPPLGCDASPICQEVDDTTDAASQIYRCPDATGNWIIGNIDPTVVPLTDSPGAGNPCPFCGDGNIDMDFGETCDDSGESATCDDDCTAVSCGDGTVNMTAGEACDDAGESATCNDDCSVASCGDGITNAAAGEDCDDSGESATCNDNCTTATCGDGITNAAAGEDCDDTGESATCNANCTTATCGDSVVNTTAGENCDDGGRSDMCNVDCTAVSCGDGVLNVSAGEQCDDAGESATCDDDCTDAICGDGATNATAGEECDDGNTDDGDGCAADCTTEDDPGTTTGDTESSSGGDDSSTGDATGNDTDSGTGDDTDSSADDSSTGGGGSSTGSTATGSTTTTTGPVTTMTSAGTSGSDENEDDGDTDTAGADDDAGCGCSTHEDGGAPWSMLALLGLVGLRLRRRRRA